MMRKNIFICIAFGMLILAGCAPSNPVSAFPTATPSLSPTTGPMLTETPLTGPISDLALISAEGSILGQLTIVDVAVKNHGPDVFTGSQVIICTGEGVLRQSVSCPQGDGCPQEYSVDVIGEWPAFSMEFNTYYWSFKPDTLFDSLLYKYDVICTISGSNDPNLGNNSSAFTNP